MVNPSAPQSTWRLLDLSLASAVENLALEEALARSISSPSFQPTLRLWVDPPAVVVGRFQNVGSEVDVALCREKKVQIVRRFTGGGAVFHDEGNLNLTLVIRRPQRIRLNDFQWKNSSIILSSLESLGLKGNFVTPNSVHVDGKKVAGAASALGRDFALWHASILVSTNIDLLNQLLAPSKEPEEKTFIHSRWHPVTTLVRALGKPVSIGEVKYHLKVATETSFGARFSVSGLEGYEKECMNSLLEGKYSTEEWNLSGICRE